MLTAFGGPGCSGVQRPPRLLRQASPLRRKHIETRTLHLNLRMPLAAQSDLLPHAIVTHRRGLLREALPRLVLIAPRSQGHPLLLSSDKPCQLHVGCRLAATALVSACTHLDVVHPMTRVCEPLEGDTHVRRRRRRDVDVEGRGLCASCCGGGRGQGCWGERWDCTHARHHEPGCQNA